MLQKLQSKLELTGSLVALACAIHCISIPVLLSIGSIGLIPWLDHTFVELGFLAATLTIAGWSLFGSYRKKMVNSVPLMLFFFGFTSLIVSILFHFHVLSALGGILIASAHFFNWKQLREVKA